MKLYPTKQDYEHENPGALDEEVVILLSSSLTTVEAEKIPSYTAKAQCTVILRQVKWKLEDSAEGRPWCPGIDLLS